MILVLGDKRMEHNLKDGTCSINLESTESAGAAEQTKTRLIVSELHSGYHGACEHNTL
jgi:hypothetical protein